MDFKDAVSKLDELKESGFLTAEDYERRKRDLVDQYIGVPSGSSGSGAVVASGVGGGVPRATGSGSTAVKLRGLPYTCTEQDVVNFFYGFNLDPTEPVKFQMQADGKHSGICYVKFQTEEEAAHSLSKNKQYMGTRYVEVFPSTVEEMQSKTAPIALQGAANWVRMRGLPYSCTVQEIKEFFVGFGLLENCIFIINGKGGRPSGEAYVQFTDTYEAQRALMKDKELLGTRYIELFLATREECDAAIARHTRDTRMAAGMGFGGGFGGGYGGYGRSMGGMGGMGMSGMGAMGGGAGDNTARLRGLPFRATESDIMSFFQGIELTRVEMVYQGGRPSGECFVEFKYAQGLEQGLQRNRQMMGTRYIEVFRSSKVEMEQRVAGGMGGMGSYGGMGGAAAYGGYGAGFAGQGYSQF